MIEDNVSSLLFLFFEVISSIGCMHIDLVKYTSIKLYRI